MTLSPIVSNILDTMGRKTPKLLPNAQRILHEIGENIKNARLRRNLSATQVAERANITRQTLASVEQGAPTVAMGTYLQVLFVLGLEKTLLHVAENDALGRRLQDANLKNPRRKGKSGT